MPLPFPAQTIPDGTLLTFSDAVTTAVVNGAVATAPAVALAAGNAAVEPGQIVTGAGVSSSAAHAMVVMVTHAMMAIVAMAMVTMTRRTSSPCSSATCATALLRGRGRGRELRRFH